MSGLGSAGAGWFANYVRGRSKLDAVIDQWHSRTHRKAEWDRQTMAEEAQCHAVRDELAELRLVVASMLRALRQTGFLEKRKEEAMSSAAGLLATYLGESPDRTDGEAFAVAPSDLAMVVEQLAEMRLVVACMLQLLVRSGTLSTEQLEALAVEIDALDGRTDGKFTGEIGVDGTIVTPPEETPDALDELSDAAQRS